MAESLEASIPVEREAVPRAEPERESTVLSYHDIYRKIFA